MRIAAVLPGGAQTDRTVQNAENNVNFLGRFAVKNSSHLKMTLAPAMLAGVALLFVAQSARTDDSDEHKLTGITDCGTVISESGRYFLANDLKDCPGFGISIAVSNVKVELRGHTIQGTSGDNAINAKGDDTGLSGIEIDGPGTVTGGIAGVAFGNVHHSRVHGLVLVRNNFGIAVNSGDFTSDATVAASASTDNEIRDNVITSNAFHGITVNGGDENQFIRNNLSGNGNHGLFLSVASNNVARGNTADMNGGSGIDAGTFGSGNQVEGNVALGNGGPDLNDENGDCIRNTWTDNSFTTNSPGCIE
jgi:parallel beta-helix repeat protein